MTTCSEPGCELDAGLIRFHPDPYCLHHSPPAPRAQPSTQAARTAARASFRDRMTRPRESRDAAEHDAAIEAFVEQLHRSRVPKGAA